MRSGIIRMLRKSCDAPFDVGARGWLIGETRREIEIRVRNSACVYQICLSQTNLFERRLKTAIVQQGDLRGDVSRQGTLQQVANLCETLLARTLLAFPGYHTNGSFPSILGNRSERIFMTGESGQCQRR